MKRKIKDELQDEENQSSTDPYQLKTDEEIIEMIVEFGNGELEFHTLDINRIIVENERMKNLVVEFEHFKMKHELPNNNTDQYNVGYVQCCNDVINKLRSIF